MTNHFFMSVLIFKCLSNTKQLPKFAVHDTIYSCHMMIAEQISYLELHNIYLLNIKNCRILIPEVNLITVILRYNSTISSAELWCYDESGDR